MGEAIEYLSQYRLYEIVNIMFFSITMIVVTVRMIEKILKKIYSYFLFLYNKKRGKENEKESIEKSIKQIGELSNAVMEIEKRQNANVDMFTQHEIGIINTLECLSVKMNELCDSVKTLDSKLDMQEKEIKDNNDSNNTLDLTLLRDRIMGGMRFFNQNKDEDGNVHISLSDHENMSHLFEEYFKRNGNGTVKKKYENEFSKFIIDD